MTHTTLFTTADIAKVPLNALSFPPDPRSQRARNAASRSLPTGSPTTLLSEEVLVQIVSLENISTSKSAQLDELLTLSDIESVGADRQRYRIVRDVDVEADQQPGANTNITSQTNTNQYFKLTVQDTAGNLSYAVELEKLSFLSSKNLKSGFPIQLGSKILLKQQCEMNEGVFLITPATVEYLGGIVPEWNYKLAERHAALLKEQIQSTEA